MSAPEFRDVLIALWPIGGEISIHQHAADCSWETAMECRPLALKRVRIQVGEFTQSPADDQNRMVDQAIKTIAHHGYEGCEYGNMDPETGAVECRKESRGECNCYEFSEAIDSLRALKVPA
jgi:hypothetical protein